MTSTHDEAASVATLLDYYVRGEDIDLHSVHGAWTTLLEAYRDSLSWYGVRHLENIPPRGQLAPEPNEDAADDCPACMDDGDGFCRYHAGDLHGYTSAMSHAADVLKAFSRDPELVETVQQQDEENRDLQRRERRHSEAHHIDRYVRSVRFESDQQIESWADELTLEITGRQPQHASFAGDRHGIYVGPERTLVRPGGRVEAVIDQHAVEVWFRPGYPTQ